MRPFTLTFALSFATSAILTFAQSPPPSATLEKLTGQFPQNLDPSLPVFPDQEWEGQLVEVTPTEKRFFRTRRNGAKIDAVKVEYGGDGSVLVGLDCNVETENSKTVVNSI